MLGEAARTSADADRYFDSYAECVVQLGRTNDTGDPIAGDGLSVKLSALHPRYSYEQHARCVPALVERLGALARSCRDYGLGLTVDAEEARPPTGG